MSAIEPTHLNKQIQLLPELVSYSTEMVLFCVGLGKVVQNTVPLSKSVSKIIPPTLAPFIFSKRSISLKPNFSKFKLTPPPPGGVVGGFNDAFKPPEANHFHGSYHWDYERITAVSLLPLTTIPLYIALSGGVVPPLLDAAMCTALLLHVQYGLTSCIIDYIPKRKFGIWHDIARFLLYGGCALGLYGVYDLETNNNGLVDLIGNLWKDDDSRIYIFGRN